jgi:hypothetical protein
MTWWRDSQQLFEECAAGDYFKLPRTTTKMQNNEPFDFSFLLEDTTVRRFVGRKTTKQPVKKRRAYNKVKAASTRARNKCLRDAGMSIPPSYNRKTKRPYRQSGKYRGARVMQGGSVRNFNKPDLQYLNDIHSKFMTTEGKPHTFCGGKKKDDPK